MFKLQPNPTFNATVEFPIPGGKAKFDVEYKFFDEDQWKEFIEAHKEQSVVETLPKIIVGWKGVDTPYSEETVKAMFKRYRSSAVAMWETFLKETFGAPEKN